MISKIVLDPFELQKNLILVLHDYEPPDGFSNLSVAVDMYKI